MGKKAEIDFDSLTVKEIENLTNYQYGRYKVWAQSKKRKNEIKTNFLKQFQKSCDKYKD